MKVSEVEFPTGNHYRQYPDTRVVAQVLYGRRKSLAELAAREATGEPFSGEDGY